MRERSHEVVGFRAETVAQDLRFAIRQLRKSPGFAVTAILMLMLGIGASTAIFGFVDAALIQPLPYAQQSRLVDVDESAEAFPRSNISREDYEDWKRMNTTLQSLDVYTGSGFLLRIGSTAEPVPAARVSDGFFHTLGVQPMLGRDFRPGEDMPGGAKIVTLSYGTWMTRFGGRRDVIGEAVSLSGDPYTIVGVLPRNFAFAPTAARRCGCRCWIRLLASSAEAATTSMGWRGCVTESRLSRRGRICRRLRRSWRFSIRRRIRVRARACRRCRSSSSARCGRFCSRCWQARDCCC
jgi:hypothetical protein